eukprot:TRINITY_DN31261_c0_g1_i3.p1 TRINITY_DN31261_c0_g1~~TRINITY_DN31261_c0_g1_i3.p1  ORF type:complete len:169 (-),score=37.64 TRINITY_DN31261_c0_g1_i3:218-724(-)
MANITKLTDDLLSAAMSYTVAEAAEDPDDGERRLQFAFFLDPSLRLASCVLNVLAANTAVSRLGFTIQKEVIRCPHKDKTKVLNDACTLDALGIVGILASVGASVAWACSTCIQRMNADAACAATVVQYVQAAVVLAQTAMSLETGLCLRPAGAPIVPAIATGPRRRP